MAVILADPGGEYYFSLSAAALVTAGRWTQFTSGGGAGVSNSAPAGRQAASDGKVYALLINSGGTATRTFTVSYGHLIMGFAIYQPSTPTSVTVARFLDTGSIQTDVRTDAGGHLVLTRNGTVLGTSTPLLSPGWNYLEMDVTFATGATGTADLWLNGVRVLHLTSVQTASTANANANQVQLVGPQNTSYFRDIYVIDASTGSNTSPLGDVTVGVKYPNAAGVNQQWTASSGTQVSLRPGRHHPQRHMARRRHKLYLRWHRGTHQRLRS